MARERLDPEPAPTPKAIAKARAATNAPGDVTFFSCGCTLLDCALGGGWAERRVINIVGDKSAGKTLLAMEAAANFAIRYKNGIIRYKECEAAFDPRYASNLGVPMDRIDFGKSLETVEDLFEELNAAVKQKTPQLVIVDSLDALTDRAETERDIDEGTYGTNKARKMSEMFRRLVRKMDQSDLTLIIISQVRSKIGLSFGRQTTRTGGKALDFYASQIVYLSHMETVYRTVGSVKRPIAIEVAAKLDKNKVGLPLREARFRLDFGYGIDDLVTCMMWLKEVGHLNGVGITDKEYTKFVKSIANAETEKEYRARLLPIQKAVKLAWNEIESGFLPRRRKYNGIS
jgi:recombination protein RecA